MHTKHVLVAAVLALGLGSGVAFAASSDDSTEVASLAAATVSAADAVASAEKEGAGKVVELTLVDEGGMPVYHVTVLQPDGTEANFSVDAKTGVVTATADDNGDESASETENENDDNGGAEAAGEK
ncbi:MAG: hypothetical protein JWQ89_3170 [Devosia sp.]|uniref:PepSY domain-containing protein n=1 Tax=Devosia sp. TaxID=1871048 RepID=UPI0026309F05|nr:PepSY domain-containing protein [Devosia sp.]MDB5541443.1 hypothetical protein [Devosia sp.]